MIIAAGADKVANPINYAVKDNINNYTPVNKQK